MRDFIHHAFCAFCTVQTIGERSGERLAHRIASKGARASTYTEQQGAAVMAQAEITIRIELGRGECCETIWTTDLSHEYVKINAEYRT